MKEESLQYGIEQLSKRWSILSMRTPKRFPGLFTKSRRIGIGLRSLSLLLDRTCSWRRLNCCTVRMRGMTGGLRGLCVEWTPFAACLHSRIMARL